MLSLFSSPKKNAIQIVEPNRSSGRLTLHEKSLDCLMKHMKNCVVLVGPAGVGKSSLCTSMYNQMRNDQEDYFYISNSDEGETHGLWTVSEAIKVKNAHKDYLDVIDCEGLEAVEASHYVIVAALVLAKAVVVCKGGRVDRGVMKTIKEGLDLFIKLKLAIPKPVLFIQISENPSLRGGVSCSPEAFLEDFMKDYTSPGIEMHHFTMHRFDPSLPIEQHKKLRLTDTKYLADVDRLLSGLRSIKEKMNIEDRVAYLKKVVNAINTQDYTFIINVNLNFFKANILEILVEIIKAENLAIRERHERREVDQNTKTIDKWADSPKSCYNYFEKRCKSSPYYIDTGAFKSEIEKNKDRCKLDPQNIVNDIFTVKLAEWQKRMNQIGKSRLTEFTIQMEQITMQFVGGVTQFRS